MVRWSCSKIIHRDSPCNSSRRSMFFIRDHSEYSMDFSDVETPDIRKPILVAAMQDMGNIGSIVIHLINKSFNTLPFRYVSACYPNYVIDKGGHIEFQQERWEYRYGKDIIVFGGGLGQPQTNEELYKLCQDVINIA